MLYDFHCSYPGYYLCNDAYACTTTINADLSARFGTDVQPTNNVSGELTASCAWSPFDSYGFLSNMNGVGSTNQGTLTQDDDIPFYLDLVEQGYYNYKVANGSCSLTGGNLNPNGPSNCATFAVGSFNAGNFPFGLGGMRASVQGVNSNSAIQYLNSPAYSLFHRLKDYGCSGGPQSMSQPNTCGNPYGVGRFDGMCDLYLTGSVNQDPNNPALTCKHLIECREVVVSLLMSVVVQSNVLTQVN